MKVTTTTDDSPYLFHTKSIYSVFTTQSLYIVYLLHKVTTPTDNSHNVSRSAPWYLYYRKSICSAFSLKTVDMASPVSMYRMCSLCIP